MLDPRDAIDRINDIYGRHPRHRALHARGTFYTGTFTATPEATALCTAEPFSGDPVPVLVRWSNGGGNPERHDNAPRRARDGGEVPGRRRRHRPPRPDVAALPGADARGVHLDDRGRASGRRPSPCGCASSGHGAGARRRPPRARALGPPYSYAEVSYYPIHAYGWVAADGSRSLGPLRPLAGRRARRATGGRLRRARAADGRDAGAAGQRAGALRPAGDRRGRRGRPARPDLGLEGRPRAHRGRHRGDGRRCDDPEESGGPVVFDPTRVVDGIELSDDPILRYRPAAYSESIARRTSDPRLIARPATAVKRRARRRSRTLGRMTLPYAEPLTVIDPADLVVPEPPAPGRGRRRALLPVQRRLRLEPDLVRPTPGPSTTRARPGCPARCGWPRGRTSTRSPTCRAEVATTFAGVCGRVERAVLALGDVGRVHLYRWGDGGAHFHVWFVPRPLGGST